MVNLNHHKFFCWIPSMLLLDCKKMLCVRKNWKDERSDQKFAFSHGKNGRD